MIIQGSHAPCSIPYHTFFPNRMLIGKLMYPLRLSKTYPQKSLSPPRFPFLGTESFLTVKECFFLPLSLLQGELHLSHQASLSSGTRGCSWLRYSLRQSFSIVSGACAHKGLPMRTYAT